MFFVYIFIYLLSHFVVLLMGSDTDSNSRFKFCTCMAAFLQKGFSFLVLVHITASCTREKELNKMYFSYF